MKLLRRFVCLLLALFGVHVHAQALVLPEGLAVDPDDTLDLTYQVVPDFDEHQKVLAGWEGDKLRYVVTVEKLPPGWLEAQKYFQVLVRDLRATGRTVEPGRTGEYKARSSLTGRYLELRLRSSAQGVTTTQIAHFLTNGRVAFIAFANAVGADSAERTLDESQRLFKTASLPGNAPSVAPQVSNETPYIGTWRWTGTAPDGRPASSTVVLKPDLSFTSDLVVDGRQRLRAAGVWQVSAQRLLWTYTDSQPPLPVREDEDEIVSLAGDRLVLRSKLSGKEREFRRQ